MCIRDSYIDVLTNEPLTEQIVDETKHEGDSYTTEEKAFENYDMIKVEGAVTIEDKLPEGMNLVNNDGTWEEQDGICLLYTSLY